MIDKDLKQHVQNALDWEPSVEATDIGVSVDKSVVTLRGNVASYSAKIAAERAALRVYGVKAVANDLTVRLKSSYQRTDTEIAQAALATLKWNTVVPGDRVTLVVKTTDVRDKIEAAFKRSAEIDARRVNVTAQDGQVILSGNVHSWAERQEAERAAWSAPGVTHVDDRLTVAP